MKLLICAMLCVVVSAACGQGFADRVSNFSPGVNAGFGAAHFPQNVLGPPEGTNNPQTPNFREEDLLTLGTGGSITLEWTTTKIIDGPGPDIMVFENPVQPISDPNQTFADSAIVSVSNDGVNWTTFPFNIVSTASADLKFKANFIGFAGIQPTFSNTTNGISPFDPAVAGGDAYNLTNVGMTEARFVKITDTGTTSTAPTIDPDGDIVNDFGNLTDPDPLSPGSGRSSGFDLDAVAARYTGSAMSTVPALLWQLYE